MHLDPNAPIDPKTRQKARIFAESLPAVPPGLLRRLYLHWSGYDYTTTFDDYHGMAVYRQGSWQIAYTHDPRDNARQIQPGDSYAAHTLHRNSFALGVCIAAMKDATVEDFGEFPITQSGLEMTLACAAAFCHRYGIQTGEQLGPREFSVMTHCECAINDGYAFDRWDIGILSPGETLSIASGRHYGDLCRRRLHNFVIALRA